MSKEQQETITISERLDEYLKKRDFELEYSDDRKKLFEGMDNDPLLVNYLDSDQYIRNHVKNKKDRLSEHDMFCKKLDSISYYILKSEFKNERHKENFESDKTGKVLNNTGENNKAYKRDYKIKEEERVYGYPVMSVYAMNRNRSEAPLHRKRESFILSEFWSRFGKNNKITEEEACEILSEQNKKRYRLAPIDIYNRIIFSLIDPKKVLLFFRYEQEVLAEIEGDPNSELYLVSNVLNDICRDLDLEKKDRIILSYLRNGMKFSDIKNILNIKKFGVDYEEIRYRSRVIAQKIAFELESKISNLL